MPDKNPWLSIDYMDYEGHMSCGSVRQLQMLNVIFAESLKEYNPDSIAVLGCTVGNGFEHIDHSSCTRVCAIDINPDYLSEAERRYGSDGIEYICADLDEYDLGESEYDLVFCGLIFEYLDATKLLRNIYGSLKQDAVVVVLLQMADKKKPKVSETEYKSLESLDAVMHMLDIQEFIGKCVDSKFIVLGKSYIKLESGKIFAHILLKA